MKNINILLMLLFTAIAISTLPAQAQTTPEPLPYIMYWDTENTDLPQIVIERADGTERHAVGAGMIAPDVTLPTAVEVSPSGKWLAVNAERHEKFGPYWSSTTLINLHDNTEFQLETDIVDSTFAWHPERDWLLLYTLHLEPGRNEILNDPEFNVFDNSIAPLRESRLRIFDLTDTPTILTEHAFSYLYDENASSDAGLREKLIGFAAETAYLFYGDENTPDTDTFILMNEQGVFFEDAVGTVNYRVTPHGILARTIDNVISLDDLATATPDGFSISTTLDVTPGSGKAVTWAPDGTALAIRDESFNLVYIDLTDFADGTPLAPEIVYDDILLSAGDDYFSSFYPSSEWSDDGDYLVLTDNATLLPLVFDRASGTVLALPDGVRGYPSAWQGSNLLLVDRDEDGMARVHVYDAATDNVTTQSRQLPPYAVVDVSVGGNFVTLIDQYELVTINMTDGTTILNSPDSRSYFSNPIGETYYHPTAPFYLTFEDAVVAGGGSSRWLGIHSADGTVDRELGYCPQFQFACLQWLPEQVDIDLLPDAARPTPALEVSPIATYFNGTWTYDLEWNNDGTVLAAGGAWHNGQVNLIDLMSGSITQTALSVGTAEARLVFDDEGPAVQPLETRTLADGTIGGVILDETATRAVLVDHGAPDWTTVILIDTATGETIYSFPPLQSFFNGTSDISPDEMLLAYNGIIVDIETGEELIRLPYGDVSAMAFSPDGTQLAVASAFEVDIWTVTDLLATVQR